MINTNGMELLIQNEALFLLVPLVLLTLIMLYFSNINLDLFLKIQRIEWWGLIFVPIYIGYLIGGGTIFSPLGIALIILTLFWTGAVYSHNDIQDFYHDEESEEGRRPLQQNKSTYESCVRFFNLYTLFVFITAFLFSLFLSENRLLSVSVLFIIVIFGHAYNDSSFGNYINFGGVVASTYFSMLPFWGFSLSTSNLDHMTIIALVCSYIFLSSLYRVIIIGGIKDIDMKNEKNELREFLNAKYERKENYFYSGYTELYGGIVIILQFIILLLIIGSNEILLKMLVTIIYIVILVYNHKILRTQEWKWNSEEGYNDAFVLEIIDLLSLGISVIAFAELLQISLMLTLPVIFVLILKTILWGYD